MLQVTFLPDNITVTVQPGTTLLQAQIAAGLHPDAPCGGKGTCGKCKVTLGEKTVLACQTRVFQSMTVTLPRREGSAILTDGLSAPVHPDGLHAYAAAFDIGTTTLVGFLLDGKTGGLLATASAMNPQARYGADVIARIEAAMASPELVLQQCILPVLRQLLEELAAQSGISTAQITLVSLVGNTAMHHLLLGIDPKPLVTPPCFRSTRRACCVFWPILPVLWVQIPWPV